MGFRLRREGLEAKTAFIKVRYGNFKTITRRKTFKIGLFDDVRIYREALELLKTEIISPICLIGIGVSNLENHGILFAKKEDKNIKFLKALDAIKSNFGTTKIKRMKGL